MIKKGDAVLIKEKFQDSGDDLYQWAAVTDEEKGRVDISPVNINMTVKPVYTVTVNMLDNV